MLSSKNLRFWILISWLLQQNLYNSFGNHDWYFDHKLWSHNSCWKIDLLILLRSICFEDSLKSWLKDSWLSKISILFSGINLFSFSLQNICQSIDLSSKRMSFYFMLLIQENLKIPQKETMFVFIELQIGCWIKFSLILHHIW